MFVQLRRERLSDLSKMDECASGLMLKHCVGIILIVLGTSGRCQGVEGVDLSQPYSGKLMLDTARSVVAPVTN